MAIKERATSHYLSDNNHDITSPAAGAGQGPASSWGPPAGASPGPCECRTRVLPALPAPPAPPLRRAAPPRHLATRRVSAKLYDNMYSNVFLILSSAILLPAFGSNQAFKGKLK